MTKADLGQRALITASHVLIGFRALLVVKAKFKAELDAGAMEFKSRLDGWTGTWRARDMNDYDRIEKFESHSTDVITTML